MQSAQAGAWVILSSAGPNAAALVGKGLCGQSHAVGSPRKERSKLSKDVVGQPLRHLDTFLPPSSAAATLHNHTSSLPNSASFMNLGKDPSAPNRPMATATTTANGGDTEAKLSSSHAATSTSPQEMQYDPPCCPSLSITHSHGH